MWSSFRTRRRFSRHRGFPIFSSPAFSNMIGGSFVDQALKHNHSMNDFGFISLRLPTKALWFSLLGFALAALGFSISSVVALPVSSLAVLALAVVAAAFVNQYQFRMPSTQIAIPTASLFT